MSITISTSIIDVMKSSNMFRLAFLIGVVVVLRLEYLLAAVIVKRKAREWSANKVRIFTARVISLTHATLSSVGCICSLSSDPHYVKEPYDYSTYSAQYIFLFSMGYFIYDMIDMYIHGEALYSKEYYIHHSLVLTAFSIILRTGKLFGFAMIGLLVEVQTIFLHLRTMIRLTRYAKKKSRAYNALIYANMVCLFVFRHLTTTYLLYVMLYKDEKCPMPLRAFLVSGLLFLTYHNTHLTISMVKTDGFFGYEMQSVDEDHADPLGPVKVKKS
ncbi:TLC domain-containing protein [Trichostrongylus colubriformis]|uniref:TLC domain-containing protein n=1 Tax=Trichostrongylus colubriformis TaxID=6319 RepID=A0AAN8IG84_TRICO